MSARTDTRPAAWPTSAPRTRVDLAGVFLLLIGLTSGAFAYWLVTARGLDPLILVPAVVASTVAASNLTKREAPRDLPPTTAKGQA